VSPDQSHRAVCVQIVGLLRKEREDRGISKYALAERSGLSEQMIGYVERGMRSPSLETIVRIAAGLEVDLFEIIKRAYKKPFKTRIK
jgi:transcriptional regulator with XRE-family HTH domain